MLAGDDIDPVALFERDNWLCHLCEEPIQPHRRCPDPLAATIDHVVPLSLGGRHTWDNVKAAHAFCNFRKSNKVVLDTHDMIEYVCE